MRKDGFVLTFVYRAGDGLTNFPSSSGTLSFTFVTRSVEVVCSYMRGPAEAMRMVNGILTPLLVFR